MWPVYVQEETVAYEQDRRHAYKLVGPPSPAKDYSGEVVFTPNAAGGTDIRWSGSFIEGAGSGTVGDAGRAWRGGPVFRGSAGEGGRTRIQRRALASRTTLTAANPPPVRFGGAWGEKASSVRRTDPDPSLVSRSGAPEPRLSP